MKKHKLPIITAFTLLISFFITPITAAQNPNDKHFANIRHHQYRCSIGKGGITVDKKEGDGGTPVGEFFIRRVFYRPDRIDRKEIQTTLPMQALTRNDGWCDDPNSPAYNTHVKLPFAASHEELWRQDHVYDLILVVGYNDAPIVQGKGSAIFIHIASEGYKPTAGCLGFTKRDLLEILKHLTPKTRIQITKFGTITFKNYA